MVKIIKVDPKSPARKDLEKAAKLIEKGGLVVYPTETVYGLASDACSDESVARAFEAKSRSLEKPISVAVSSLEMARKVGKITPEAEILLREFLPGPLSIVVAARSNLSTYLSAGTGKVGIRVPKHPVAQKLIKEFGGPITSTSANISGRRAPTSARAALGQLRDRVDLVIDSGETPIRRPSTVVDVTGEELEVIREGPISAKEIKAALDQNPP